MDQVRVNIGCGRKPTAGWINFDNSFSVCLSRWPHVVDVLRKLGILNDQQYEYCKFVSTHDIRFADARKPLPLGNGSVSVLYSSHMLEHLDRLEARIFLAQVMRVLDNGGILRLVVPDLALLVRRYCNDGDADKLVSESLLTVATPRCFVDRVRGFLWGHREHKWLYDSVSLSKLLTEAGFQNVAILTSGRTRIVDPGELDLREREQESLYVEAVKPYGID